MAKYSEQDFRDALSGRKRDTQKKKSAADFEAELGDSLTRSLEQAARESRPWMSMRAPAEQTPETEKKNYTLNEVKETELNNILENMAKTMSPSDMIRTDFSGLKTAAEQRQELVDNLDNTIGEYYDKYGANGVNFLNQGMINTLKNQNAEAYGRAESELTDILQNAPRNASSYADIYREKVSGTQDKLNSVADERRQIVDAQETGALKKAGLSDREITWWKNLTEDQRREIERLSRGVDINSMTFWERLGGTLGHTITGAEKQYLASLLNSGLELTDGVFQLSGIDPQLSQKMRTWNMLRAKANGEEYDDVYNDARSFVDKEMQESASDIQYAKDVNPLADVHANLADSLVDAASSTIQSAQDALISRLFFGGAISAVPGSSNPVLSFVSDRAKDLLGMTTFGARSFGSSAFEARQYMIDNGIEIGKNERAKIWQYAGAETAIELGSEMLFSSVGAIKNASGTSIFNGFSESAGELFGRFGDAFAVWANTPGASKLIRRFGELLGGGLEEGLEEVIGDIVNEVLKTGNIIGREDDAQTVKQVLADFCVGAMSGLMGEANNAPVRAIQISQTGKSILDSGTADGQAQSTLYGELLNLARESGENTEPSKLAAKLEGKEATNVRAGQLYNAVTEHQDAVASGSELLSDIVAKDTVSNADVNELTLNETAKRAIEQITGQKIEGKLKEQRETVRSAIEQLQRMTSSQLAESANRASEINSEALASDSTPLSETNQGNTQSESRIANTGTYEQRNVQSITDSVVEAKRVSDVASFAETLPKAAGSVMTRMYSPSQDSTAYIEAFCKVRKEGMEGRSMSVIEPLNVIQARAAYTQGQYEAREASNGETDSSEQTGDRRILKTGSGKGLAKRTGRSRQQETRRTQKARSSEAGAAAKAEGWKSSSTRALGVREGSDKDSVSIVSDSFIEKHDYLKKIKAENAAKGIDTTFIYGTMRSGNVYARGWSDSTTKKVIVSINDSRATAEQINAHEVYHVETGNNISIATQIVLESGNYESLVGLYSAVYYTDSEGNLTATVDDIIIEIAADLTAGIDVLAEAYESAPELGQSVFDKARKMEERLVKEKKKQLAKEEPENSGKEGRFSLKTLADGTKYVDVDIDQELFEGLSVAEMQREAKKIILKKFKGKVIGDAYTAYVKKETAEHYAYPANHRMDPQVKQDKMKVSPELDNLLKASVYKGNSEDDGRHPDAVGGFDNLETLFRIGERVYSGEISVMLTQRGRVFYDLTRFRDITSDEIGQSILRSAEAESDASSVDNVPQSPGPVKQKISSSGTSLNQVPALHKDSRIEWGDTNVDIGAGAYEAATEFLKEKGVTNYKWDPYNQPEEVNRATLQYLKDGNKADTATCANVLNVIAEKDARLNVILQAAKAIKEDGKAYFMVYEGDGSGAGKGTTKGWQNNLKTREYVDEIKTYFDNVEQHGKLIVATDPKANLPKASWEVKPGKAERFSRTGKNSIIVKNYSREEVRERINRIAAKEETGSHSFVLLQHTPQIILDFIDPNDRSVVMTVEKAEKSINGHKQPLGVDGFKKAIDGMHTPSYIIEELTGENAGHHVLIVDLDGGEAVVAIEVGSFRRNISAIDNVEGVYNVAITAYSPDYANHIDNLFKKIGEGKARLIYDRSEDKKYEIPSHVALSESLSGRDRGISGDNVPQSSGPVKQEIDATAKKVDVTFDSASESAAPSGRASRMADAFSGFTEDQKKHYDAEDSLISEKEFSQRASRVLPDTELQQANRELQKDITELRRLLSVRTEQKEYWKGQTKVTEGHQARKEDIKRLARTLVKSEKSTANVNEITAKLQGLRDHLLNSSIQSDEEYAEWMEKATELSSDIAGDILSQSRELVESGKWYSDFREYLRTQRIYVDAVIAAELAPDGFGALRKRWFGTMNLTSDSKALEPSVVYSELASVYGDTLFPPEITNQAEQLERIMEIVDTHKTVYENPYDSNMAEAVEWLANEVMTRVIGDEVRDTAPTYADRMEKRLEAQKAKSKDAIRKVREQRDQKYKALQDHYRETRSKERERRMESAARKRLLRIARRLTNRKLPLVQKSLINQYIGDLDLVATQITGQKFEQLTQLRDWYTDRIANDPFMKDSRIENILQRLSQRRIADLTIDEVLDLTQALLNIEHALATENKLLDEEERRDIYALGMETIGNIDQVKGNMQQGALSDLGNNIARAVDSPIREIRRMTGYVDTDPLYQRTLALNEGQTASLNYVMLAQGLVEQWTNDLAFMKTITGKKAKAITISGMGINGKPATAKITPAMRMSIYLHSKNEQNLRHMREGGLTIPDFDWMRKGNTEKAYGNSQTIRLNSAQVREIISQMSDKERAYARAISRYFNEMSKENINATSLKLRGYEIALEDNYFPINTDSNFTKNDFGVMGENGDIQDMSFGWMKERVAGANNPIYLREANRVFDQAVGMHSRYCGLGVAIRDFNKLYQASGSYFNEDGERVRESVKSSIEHKWGKGGQKYITDLIQQLNGKHADKDWIAQQLSKVRGFYAGSVIPLNLGVTAKQMASYPTAAAILGFGPLAKAMKSFGKVDLNLIARYTPLQWQRSRKTIDMDRGSRNLPKALDWVREADLLTTRKLWKASEYYVRDNNKDLKAGTDAFDREVAKVYNRVIEETQPNFTTMQRGALLRSDSETAKMLFLFKTQPFQNTGILIDATGNFFAKRRQLMAATGEARAQAKANYDEAKRYFRRAIVSQVMQQAVYAGMTLAWALFRGKVKKYKDEEEEFTFSSVSGAVLKDMVANTLGGVPFGSEVFQAVDSLLLGGTYYGIDGVSISAVNDVVNSLLSVAKTWSGAAEDIVNGEKVDWNSIRIKMDSVLDTVTKVMGVPYENVANLVTAVARLTAIGVKGEYIGEYVALCLTTDPEKSKSDYYAVLYKAYVNNRDDYDTLHKAMIDSGHFTEEQITNAMRERAKSQLSSDEGYSRQYAAISSSNLWKTATESQRKEAVNKLTQLVLQQKGLGNETGAGYQEKINGGRSVGLNSVEYILYTMALQMSDTDGNGSYNQAEREAAIRKVPGLTDAERSYLWSLSYKDKNNPWK